MVDQESDDEGARWDRSQIVRRRVLNAWITLFTYSSGGPDTNAQHTQATPQAAPQGHKGAGSRRLS
jgi:hypothetical protein